MCGKDKDEEHYTCTTLSVSPTLWLVIVSWLASSLGGLLLLIVSGPMLM
jgi:hypothetical protein